MVQTLHPGVYVIEIDAQPVVTGVGVTTGGFIGLAQKGPTDKAILCTSYSQFETIFGSYYKFGTALDQTYLAYAVSGFFKSGGSACWIVRVPGATAATASGSIASIDTSIAAQSVVSAQYSGAWYNKIYVNNEKWRANVSTTIPVTAGTSISDLTVDDASGFEPGDICLIDTLVGGGTLGTTVFSETGNIQVILSIAGNVLTLGRPIKSSNASTITSCRIRTMSVHRKTIQGFRTASTSFTTASTFVDVPLGAANGLVRGQQLVIVGTSDATDPAASGSAVQGCATCIVDEVFQFDTYDRIQIISVPFFGGPATSIVGSSSSAQPPLIASLETTFSVYYSGVLVETHAYLGFSDKNERDFIGNATVAGRLYGSSTNESNYIQIAQVTSPDNNTGRFVMTNSAQLIISLASPTTGTDGTLPGTASAIVSSTALEAMKDAVDLSMLACPDIAVLKSATLEKDANKLLSDFSVENSDVMVFISNPNVATHYEGINAVQNMLTWRASLPIDSSRTALYWPFFVAPDPTVSTSPSVSSTAFSFGVGQATIKLPPVGHIMGQTAKLTASRGPHVAPANLAHVGVFDVTYHANDTDQDFLNPKGINAIRLFSGQGVRTWGARTLWSISDGRHYVPVVRLLQFIERSVREGNRFAVFQPNDPLLWAQITAANTAFLSGIWSQGMLFPSDNEEEAYFVKCDAEVNPASEREAGRVNCIIGVNPPKPAEFVVFKIGLFDGNAEIEQIIQGTNAAGFFVG